MSVPPSVRERSLDRTAAAARAIPGASAPGGVPEDQEVHPERPGRDHRPGHAVPNLLDGLDRVQAAVGAVLAHPAPNTAAPHAAQLLQRDERARGRAGHPVLGLLPQQPAGHGGDRGAGLAGVTAGGGGGGPLPVPVPGLLPDHAAGRADAAGPGHGHPAVHRLPRDRAAGQPGRPDPDLLGPGAAHLDLAAAQLRGRGAQGPGGSGGDRRRRSAAGVLAHPVPAGRAGSGRHQHLLLHHGLERIHLRAHVPRHRSGQVHAAHLRAVLLRARLGGLGGHHGRVNAVHGPGHGVLPDRAAPHGRRPGRRGGEGMIRDRELARLADAVLIPPFPGHTPPRWILSALESGLAGVTLFGPNVSDPEQISLLTSALRGATDEPVIAIDEEGGDVTRVTYWSGSLYPGNAALGAIDDPGLTERVHRAIGTDLATLGINVDLAPCVDVLDEAENPAIGTRSFGSDPALVSRHAAAAGLGPQAAGGAATAKHFPGHGSTRADTHEVVASITGDLAEVWRRDLPPFQAAIAAGVAAIMPGHLRLPELTGELPASLSAAAMPGLLRGELGFDGTIISDALEMRAVSGPYGIPEAAVMALVAGVDLLCLGRDVPEEEYHAIGAAVSEAARSGRLAAGRLEEGADRVAKLRAWLAAERVKRGLDSAGGTGGTGEVGGALAERARADGALAEAG